MSSRPGFAEKRLSVHRFQQISDNSQEGMANPNDVTIEIPLSTVPSRGGVRNPSVNTPVSPNTYQPPGESPNPNASEKTGLVPGPGPGRRRRVDTMGASVEESEDGTITTMGRIYQKILNFSIVTRYMLYVTPLAILIAIPIIVGATVAQDATIGGVPVHWFFTWIEVIWLSLWVAKLAARVLPYIFQVLCGFVSSGTRKYALILHRLQIPIATVIWTVISLVTFLPIMTLNPVKQRQNDTGTKSWEKTMKNILFALFVCSLIFLAEKALVQLISISYHRKQFDTKIKESKRNVYLLGQLYEASRSMFPMYCKEFAEEDAAVSDLITSKGSRLPRAGSAPFRMIREVGHGFGRIGEKVTAAVGDVAQELTGKEVFNPNSARSVVTLALERKRSSEALARRIWMSFVIEGREALYHDDIVEVLGAGKETEADECFQILDGDGNGDISLEEMILAVAEIGRTRKSLTHSLHDVDQAIHVLDNLLLTVAFVVSLLVFVSFVTSGFGTVIAAGATSLLSLSFVFATTAQEVLGSCIFLFVKHPFDVGDRVDIDSKAYFVERISLLFTVFRNVADHRITQVPNVVLNNLWIDNFTRSNAMHETLTIPVKFETTFVDIQNLKEELEQFVRDKDNCRDFQPELDVDVVGVGDMDKLELTVNIRHKSNWSNESVRAARRSKFMCALVSAVRKIPIRAPGAEASAEDENENDDEGKPDGDGPAKNDTTDKNTDGGMSRASTANAPQGLGLTGADSKSTGFDIGRSSVGSLQHRNRAGEASSSTFSGGLSPEHARLRSPAAEEFRDVQDGDNYQTPAASPEQKQFNINNYGSLERTASTGRRKEGARSSIPTATGGVPILAAPVPQRPAQAAAPEYYNYDSGNYYDPQDGPYDPNQPFELPSARDVSPAGVDPNQEYPSPYLRGPASPTEGRGADAEHEQMPGSFVSRRPPQAGQ
ncbi:hypothetical protein N8T08_004918 [Aspergillus melleus]|uniref:Uncharacterized protein n=1 Tax=Aspergillus melleus TaxID=138277 RepID=A0ACC3B2M0_9EURO|nr:hypothetical protein N8T08_004918 [Aspergillus melleus]